MANITQIRPSSSDRRGLGFTFLGMQQSEKQNDSDYISRAEYQMAIGVLRNEIRSLRELVMVYALKTDLPWYRRFIAWIKTKLHIGV